MMAARAMRKVDGDLMFARGERLAVRLGKGSDYSLMKLVKAGLYKKTS